MTWVLIDVSYLAYRALNSVGHLETEDVPMGVMFGFWQQFRTICNDPRVRSTKVALFFDSQRSFRAKFFPAYKRGRGKSDRPEEEWEKISLMRDQMKILRRDVFPEVGLPCYRQTGCEADDLLAEAAKNLLVEASFKGSAKRGVIITADQDLFQCISDPVHWYDPMRKVYWTPQTFELAKGIHPGRWGEVKTLSGCGSDAVPGIPGVGEQTAVRFLTNDLPPRYKAYGNITSSEGLKIRERNKHLVVLPHHRTKPINLVEPSYNVDAFFHYAEQYGLMTFLAGANKRRWEEFFTRKRPQLRRPKKGKKHD